MNREQEVREAARKFVIKHRETFFDKPLEQIQQETTLDWYMAAFALEQRKAEAMKIANALTNLAVSVGIFSDTRKLLIEEARRIRSDWGGEESGKKRT